MMNIYPKTFNIGKIQVFFQTWWQSWGLSYNQTHDEDIPVNTNWLIIGPFQFQWYTKEKLP